jgi:hypothetical protein
MAMNRDQRRALRLLAGSPLGATIMLAHGFTNDLLVDLVQEGLAPCDHRDDGCGEGQAEIGPGPAAPASPVRFLGEAIRPGVASGASVTADRETAMWRAFTRPLRNVYTRPCGADPFAYRTPVNVAGRA